MDSASEDDSLSSSQNSNRYCDCYGACGHTATIVESNNDVHVHVCDHCRMDNTCLCTCNGCTNAKQKGQRRFETCDRSKVTQRDPPVWTVFVDNHTLDRLEGLVSVTTLRHLRCAIAGSLSIQAAQHNNNLAAYHLFMRDSLKTFGIVVEREDAAAAKLELDEMIRKCPQTHPGDFCQDRVAELRQHARRVYAQFHLLARHEWYDTSSCCREWQSWNPDNVITRVGASIYNLSREATRHRSVESDDNWSLASNASAASDRQDLDGH